VNDEVLKKEPDNKEAKEGRKKVMKLLASARKKKSK